MPLTLSVPNEYGYVLLTATATTFIAHYHVYLVSRLRKLAKVPYPETYASASAAASSAAAYRFNCAQRAHANFLENEPQVLVALLIAGLKWPVAGSAVGASWCVARVMYAWGYSRAGPDGKGVPNGKGRVIGAWGSLPLLALGFMSGISAWGILGF